MDKQKAWEIFTLTGKVEDYLNFKSIKEETAPLNKINADKKDKNRRTDNKTTEYW